MDFLASGEVFLMYAVFSGAPESFSSVSSSSGTNRLGPLDEIFLLGQKVVTNQGGWAQDVGMLV